MTVSSESYLSCTKEECTTPIAMPAHMKAQECQPKYRLVNSTVRRSQLSHLRCGQARKDCEDGAVVGATPEMAHREQETTRLAFAMAVGAEAAASLGVNERRKWPIDIGSWIGSRRRTPLRDDPMHSAELGSLTQRRSVFLNHDLLVKVEFRMFPVIKT